MPTLQQLFAAHAPLLVIDAASAQVQVGVLTGPAGQRWAFSSEEAGVGVFRVLDAVGVRPADCGAWIFCDGPGSVLGIRTVAMALRAWAAIDPRPVFAYCSLAVVAEAIGRSDVGVIADARRDRWHLARRGEKLQRQSLAELPTELVMPENFRCWSAPPPGVRTVPYVLEKLLLNTLDANLYREVPAPDAFLHEEPSYVTWVPQIHRASTAPRTGA
ncbi:MAG: peptidase M22 [Verrucomicrobia bacterium]|nr:peptidase M22 [Verrucomicrobiota bacterium]